MATCSELPALLTAAETALHSLMVGGQLVRVRYNEKETEFSRANIGELRRYITDLKAQIDACNGTVTKRRAFGIIPVDG